MKHFCNNCGKATLYSLYIPKFCSHCGSDFSLVTKQKDKSAHDQAIEKLKDKYPDNVPAPVPVTKPEIKKYPNPARASFRIIQDHDSVVESDNNYETEETLEASEENINTDNFFKIKPKFQVQNIRQNSESFENMLTQSYASNYKPLNPQEMSAEFQVNHSRYTAEDILNQFRKEAGLSRGQQG